MIIESQLKPQIFGANILRFLALQFVSPFLMMRNAPPETPDKFISPDGKESLPRGSFLARAFDVHSGDMYRKG